MKTLFRTLFVLLFFILLASCATTSAGNNHIEKKQDEKRLLFEDWKYRGFGRDLPVWVESAYNDDIPGIKKVLPELADKELLIVSAEGINSDQADRILKIKEEEIFSDFTLYDSCWILSGEKYVAFALYYK